MTPLRTAIGIFAASLMLSGAGSLQAQQKDTTAVSDSPAVPVGLVPALFRVTGARASTQLATEIHCSNIDTVPLSVYVSYFNYDGMLKCSISFIDMPVGITRTFSTADAAAFAEDVFCPPPVVVIGQGRVEIATYPIGGKLNCSAQVVSLTDNPPTTLSSLDVFKAN